MNCPPMARYGGYLDVGLHSERGDFVEMMVTRRWSMWPVTADGASMIRHCPP
jgi:hypothetical protein